MDIATQIQSVSHVTKRRVAELIGPNLDYWVGKAVGRKVGIGPHDTRCRVLAGNDPDRGEWVIYAPSRIWQVAGPIIERANIALLPCGDEWAAKADDGNIDLHAEDGQRGPTALVAAMRAFVASKFGEEVGG